jgi:predicted nucleic acid-binding protein
LIAADSSVIVDLLEGRVTPQRATLEALLSEARAVLAPATIAEILSDPTGGRQAEAILSQFILLPITDGYWERAGLLRAKLRRAKRKAALGYALIAQSCIDADVALLTSDSDFEAFAKIGGLKLA